MASRHLPRFIVLMGILAVLVSLGCAACIRKLCSWWAERKAQQTGSAKELNEGGAARLLTQANSPPNGAVAQESSDEDDE